MNIDELPISQENFKEVLNLLPVGVTLYLENEQVPFFINENLLNTLGYDRLDLESKDLLQVFEEGFFLSIAKNLNLVPEENKYILDEVEFINKKGQPVFFNLVSSFVVIDDNKWILSLYRDYTDKKIKRDLLLERSEKSLREAQKIAKVGSWEWHLKDNTPYYSEGLLHIYHIKERDQFSYQTLIDSVHPEDKEKVLAVIEQIQQNNKPHNFEYRIILNSGELKYLHNIIDVFLDESGKPEKIIGIVQDITEQIITHQALEISERRLKRAHEIGSTGYWEWHIISNEVYWSEELYKLYEINIETFTKCFESVTQLTHPEDKDKFVHSIQSALANKDKRYEFDSRVITPQGNLKHFLTKAEITYNAAGNPVLMEGVAQDITKIKEAEAQLKYKEYLLQNVNDAIIATDAHLNITSWNKAAEVIYGWKEQEALGKKLFDLIALNQEMGSDKLYEQLVNNGYWKGIRKQKKKDGEAVLIHGSVIVLKGETQNIIGFVTVNRDITALQVLQDKVSESERLLQLVIDTVPQAIFWKDVYSTYIGCNLNFSLLAALSDPEQVIGKTDYDLPWTREKAEQYRQSDQVILKSGTALLNQIVKHQMNDGRIMWQNINIIPLQNKTGSVIGILGTLEDITEKIRMEEALEENKANLEAILENTDNMVWSISKEYKILAMNSEFRNFWQHISNVSLYIGDDYLNVLPDAFKKRWLKNHKKVLTGKKVYLYKRYKIKEKYFWYEVFGFPIREGNGEINGVAYMSRDVTERRKNEKLVLKYIKQHNELKIKQEKLKMLAFVQGQDEERRLISMELHDGVGQLLTALNFKMNKLSANIALEKDRKITSLITEATQLQKYAYQEIRRISENLMPQFLNDFPLHQALEQLSLVSFKNSGIEVELDIQIGTTKLVKSLEVAIFRIIQETFNNILKHSQATRIWVKLNQSKHFLFLQVKDNGSGFTRNEIKFKKGKGLTNIAQRINLLNGFFSIDSSPGEGSQIKVKIPIINEYGEDKINANR